MSSAILKNEAKYWKKIYDGHLQYVALGFDFKVKISKITLRRENEALKKCLKYGEILRRSDGLLKVFD